MVARTIRPTPCRSGSPVAAENLVTALERRRRRGPTVGADWSRRGGAICASPGTLRVLGVFRRRCGAWLPSAAYRRGCAGRRHIGGGRGRRGGPRVASGVRVPVL